MADVNEIRERLRAMEREAAVNPQSSRTVEDVQRQLRQAEHHVRGNNIFEEGLIRDRAARMEAVMRSADEGSFGNDLMMGARALVDGMWLNKGEEISSWVSAAAWKIISPSEEKSLTEVREEMLARSEAESQRFREENPMTALGLNILGGVASPASLYGGQLLQTGRTLRQGAQASRAAPAILGATDETAMASQQLARQMAAGGMQGRATLGPVQNALMSSREAVAAVAARTPTWMQATALAGTEGAVFGYEGATTEEKIENAMWSGALSAAFPMGFEGAGRLWNGITRRRTAQDLGGGDDFINLMFTEGYKGQTGASDVYRYLVGKAFSSNSMLGQQVNNLISKFPKKAADLKNQQSNMLRDAQSALNNVRYVQGRNKELAIEAAEEIQKDAKGRLKASKRISGDTRANGYDQRLQELTDTTNLTISRIEREAVMEADAAVNALNAEFRSNTLLRSLPSEADETGDLITTLDPQDALLRLDDLWNKFGFKSAKSANYKVNTDLIMGKITRMANKDIAIVSGLARNGSGVDTVLTTIRETLERNVKKGTIKGDAMIKLRSDIGRFIGELGEGSTAVRQLSDDIQDYLDDIIVKQLDGKAAADFKTDRSLWKNKLMVQEATTKATGGNKLQQGAYTAEDWIEATKSRSKGFAARGKGVMQKEAQKVSQLSRQRDEAIKKYADKLTDEAASQKAKTILAMKAENRAAVSKAASDHAEEIRKIDAEFRVSKKDATAIAERNIKKQQAKNNIQALNSRYAEDMQRLRDQEKLLKGLKSSANDKLSIFERAFATGVLGTVVGTAFGRSLDTASTLLLGTATASLLKPQTVQRAIAGQTGVQQSLYGFGQGVGRAADTLTRSGAVPSLFGSAFNNVVNRDQ